MRRAVVLVCVVVGLPVRAAHAQPSTCGEGPQPPASSIPWVDAMPAPVDTSITSFDAPVSSADGTRLSARVYLPDAFPDRKPTILWISPYFDQGEALEDAGAQPIADCFASFLLRRGYAVVLADSRGTNHSAGCPDRNGGPSTREDGKAFVDWIAGQEWSDGNVGAVGLSLEGQAAYAAAIAAPAALKAIVAGSPTNGYDILYYGGVPWEHRYVYPVIDAPYLVRDGNVCDDVVTTSLSLDGTRSAYWRDRDLPALAERIHVPVLHTHGTAGEGPSIDSTWEFPAYWEGLGRAGVPRKAYVGPWQHGWPNLYRWDYYELRWFEHWLRGNDTGMMDEPPLTLIGSDGVARTADVFPSGDTITLHAGAGRLAADATGGLASYTDVPQLHRALLRSGHGLSLVYAGDALDAPLRISGDSALDIVASIDRTSTHFVARLYDAAPDGTAHTLTFGYLDALNRHSPDASDPVVPGAAEHYRIKLYAPEYVVPAGHHLELAIASSDFCGVEILMNVTGDCRAFGVISDPSAATVTVDESQTRLELSTAPA